MDFSRRQQILVGTEIIHHLGSQAANVDGVGAGQAEGELFPLERSENLLHTGLGIVKIAPDGAHRHVAPLLGDHLRPLHLAHAPIGVEHANAHPGHIPEAHQGGLAGIAGGGGENHDVLRYPLFPLGSGEQLGQHGKRHILKCRGGAPEQLQHGAVSHGNAGGQILGFKFTGVGVGNQLGHIGDVRQQRREDGAGDFLAASREQLLPVQRRNLLGHIQPAVRGKSLQHRLGTVNKILVVSCGVIAHSVLLYCN